jgi:hypothetical protein
VKSVSIDVILREGKVHEYKIKPNKTVNITFLGNYSEEEKQSDKTCKNANCKVEKIKTQQDE